MWVLQFFIKERIPNNKNKQDIACFYEMYTYSLLIYLIRIAQDFWRKWSWMDDAIRE